MTDKNRLRLGVVGAGHLGKIHLKCVEASEKIELAGFYELNPLVREDVGRHFRAFDSLDELMAVCDLIAVVTPTPTHYQIARQALEAGKHVFIEKPITFLPDEARMLWELSEKTGLKVQVGHVERFNPALLAVKHIDLQPRFIEGHRLAHFNPRGTDVSVVLDLMIHDLDLVLSMVDETVSDIKASGVCVVSDTHDICNARIQFANGTVANLTASRLSLKQMRKLRLFQENAYISIDFLKKEAQIVELLETEQETNGGSVVFPLESADPPRWVKLSSPVTPEVNPIQAELESFCSCISEDKLPAVGIQQGYEALLLATKIIEAIDHN